MQPNLPAPARIVLGAAIACIVTLVAWLPPILHFFTGPVGPAIGGFIAGKQLKLSDREAAIMGVLVAVAAGVPIYLLMNDLISNSTFAVIAAVVASLWSGGLSTVAAWFAGSDEEAEAEEAL